MDEVRSYKQLPNKAQILDHMGSTELVANLFRITQTMKERSGIMPEDLPVAEDVKRIAA
jgi:hypothetical protein